MIRDIPMYSMQAEIAIRIIFPYFSSHKTMLTVPVAVSPCGRSWFPTPRLVCSRRCRSHGCSCRLCDFWVQRIWITIVYNQIKFQIFWIQMNFWNCPNSNRIVEYTQKLLVIIMVTLSHNFWNRISTMQFVRQCHLLDITFWLCSF